MFSLGSKWRELLIVLLIALLALAGSKYSEVSEQRDQLRTELIKAKETSSNVTIEHVTIVETRPDGTTVTTTKSTDSTTKSTKSTKSSTTDKSSESIVKLNQKNYQFGVYHPLSGIDAPSFNRLTFDAGIRLFGAPVFGVLQYRKSEFSIGARIEF